MPFSLKRILSLVIVFKVPYFENDNIKILGYEKFRFFTVCASQSVTMLYYPHCQYGRSTQWRPFEIFYALIKGP